jgi:hypothetical protein
MEQEGLEGRALASADEWTPSAALYKIFRKLLRYYSNSAW